MRATGMLRWCGQCADQLWSALKAALITTALVAAVTGWLVYEHLDDQVRRSVERVFAEHYDELLVSVRSARLVPGEGIEVRGLQLAESSAAGPRAELADFQDVLFCCATNLDDLARGKPKICRVVVRRATLRATRRPDGSWSLGRLLPLPSLGRVPPDVLVENATLEVFDPLKTPASTLILRDLRLRLTPDLEAPRAEGEKPPYQISGQFSGDHLLRGEIRGLVSTQKGPWVLSGELQGLQVGPELLAALPGELPHTELLPESFRGVSRAKFRILRPADRALPLSFHVAGSLSDGQAGDARWPEALTGVAAQFEVTPEQLLVTDGQARVGHSQWTFSYVQDGLSAPRRQELQLRAEEFLIDDRLVCLLTPAQLVTWRRFQPQGTLDVQARLTRVADGAWQPDVNVQCRDLATTFYKFPYRVRRGRGTLRWVGRQTEFDLAAQAAGADVRIVGAWSLEQPGGAGWVEVRGDKFTVDSEVVAALPPKARQVVASLRPRGQFDLYARYVRPPQADAAPEKYVLLTLHNAAVNYEKFAYPLSELRGRVEMRDDRWTFHDDLAGRNDTALVSCRGSLVPPAEGGRLTLNFSAQRVPLEEELHAALSPGAQQLWRDLRPSGFVNLEIDYAADPGAPPELRVRGQPLEETVSIVPIRFPFRLEALQGVFTYGAGTIELAGLRARHGETRLAADGACFLLDRGRWRLALPRLAVDRLQADRDLLEALPAQLRRIVSGLKLSGAVNVTGGFELASTGDPAAPLTSAWDVAFQLHQNALHCGVPLENLFGAVRLAGDFNGAEVRSRGELVLDSLTFRGVQLADVRGPLWVDNRQVLLGKWATPDAPEAQQRALRATAAEGRLAADAWVVFDETPRYGLQLQMEQANLAQLLRESGSPRGEIRGLLSGTLNLRGRGKGAYDLAGYGNLQLREADIYRLPAMVALLKLLSVRPPDATAFTKSDIDFRIAGEHVYFDRLDFNGDAVSLVGKGEMNLARELDCTFHAMVGRDEVRIPLLHELVGSASEQLMLIQVQGTLDAPEVSRVPFPLVNEALQQLGLTPPPPEERLGWRLRNLK